MSRAIIQLQHYAVLIILAAIPIKWVESKHSLGVWVGGITLTLQFTSSNVSAWNAKENETNAYFVAIMLKYCNNNVHNITAARDALKKYLLKGLS